MDAVNDASIHTIAIMASSQIGKTEIINNIVGFHIHHDPAPMLLIQPTLELAEAWSKDRLAPMLRDTPALHGKVADARERDSGNTIKHKSFAGGQITMAGANSPASLASRPIRILLVDEVDRFPESAGEEGDPFNLAKKRTTTFWNKKIVAVSTPTIKDKSRIEALYKTSDQNEYYVVCDDCDQHQTLKWSNVFWDKDEETGEHLPDTAHMTCEGCGSVWEDADRWRMVNSAEDDGGGWKAKKPHKGIVGFHLNELYSTWVELEETVVTFLEAKEKPELLKTWTNTAMGETWDDAGEKVNPEGLMERCESYTAEMLPADVLVLTIGGDVQADRIESTLWAWGVGEEAWQCEHMIFYGDPELPPDNPESPWLDFDNYRKSVWHTEDGRAIRCAAAGIDASYIPDKVMAYTHPRRKQRVFALMGQAGQGRPIWPQKASRQKKKRATYYSVGVDQAKSLLYTRLNRIPEPAPGYLHFAMDTNQEYFDQLTAEKAVDKKVRGRKRRNWVPIRERNEALDCFVYAYAVLLSFGLNYLKLQAMLVAKKRDKTGWVPPPDDDSGGEENAPPPQEQTKTIPSPPRNPRVRDNFLNSRGKRSSRKGKGWLR